MWRRCLEIQPHAASVQKGSSDAGVFGATEVMNATQNPASFTESAWTFTDFDAWQQRAIPRPLLWRKLHVHHVEERSRRNIQGTLVTQTPRNRAKSWVRHKPRFSHDMGFLSKLRTHCNPWAKSPLVWVSNLRAETAQQPFSRVNKQSLTSSWNLQACHQNHHSTKLTKLLGDKHRAGDVDSC